MFISVIFSSCLYDNVILFIVDFWTIIHILENIYFIYFFQIVRALVHRFVLKEPISEFTQDKDPSLEKGNEIDEYSKTITLAIVFSAFIISPLTDCLGSVLELNVNFTFVFFLTLVYYRYYF